jgi:hypothetical protein
VGGGVTPAVTDPREREEEEFGEEGADGWGRLVGEGRERDRVPVREEALLGHGLASSLGRNGALWPISIFFFLFFFFFFLFSYFLYIFCKFDSNCFKPIL